MFCTPLEFPIRVGEPLVRCFRRCTWDEAEVFCKRLNKQALCNLEKSHVQYMYQGRFWKARNRHGIRRLTSGRAEGIQRNTETGCGRWDYRTGKLDVRVFISTKVGVTGIAGSRVRSRGDSAARGDGGFVKKVFDAGGGEDMRR